jgi:glyceraldehyde-3-phosphate dehydrogenase/erythrose-4-phosphate dehydrogenase
MTKLKLGINGFERIGRLVIHATESTQVKADGPSKMRGIIRKVGISSSVNSIVEFR